MVMWRGNAILCKDFVFWASKPLRHEKDRLGLPYLFVDHGFFDIQWMSALPILLAGHLFFVYGIYISFAENLWSTVVICKEHLSP